MIVSDWSISSLIDIEERPRFIDNSAILCNQLAFDFIRFILR